jgi:hypothetical protein
MLAVVAVTAAALAVFASTIPLSMYTLLLKSPIKSAMSCRMLASHEVNAKVSSSTNKIGIKAFFITSSS